MVRRRGMGDAASTATAIGAVGGVAAIGVGLLEAYALYRVWKAGGTKSWPWYVLGVLVGLDVAGRVIGGGLLTATAVNLPTTAAAAVLPSAQPTVTDDLPVL